jgi:ubiquinone/menaquinone biosynthesis C-methylase UbiE
MSAKSPTDTYWNHRAASEPLAAKVNISDTVQRDLELQFVLAHLESGMRMVEVGCGNGYVSRQLRERVAYVDAFDYSEEMIKSARSLFGETNNRFFHDSILNLTEARGPYDAALCARVLINLRDLSEQKLAVRNLRRLVGLGGRVILIEGFRDGFEAINKFRKTIGLKAAEPASINFYSYLNELLPEINENFLIQQTWHSGLFDFLTRVVYAQLVGADVATEPGEFHSKIEPIVRAYNGVDMASFARLYGFVLSGR